MYGELELRNRLFQESHAKDSPRIERLEKYLLRRSWSSKTCENWGIIHAPGEESYDCESVGGSDSEITEQRQFLVWRKRILWPWIREQLGSDARSRSKPLLFWVLGSCRAAILDCRETHRCVQVLWKETFLNDHLLKKDYLLQSSTIQYEIDTWYFPLVRIDNVTALSFVVHGRSSLVESFVWFIPFLCIKRRQKMEEKRRKDQEIKRRWGETRYRDEKRRKKFFSVNNVSNQKNPPDELSHNDSRTIPVDELFVRKFRISPVFPNIYMIRIRISVPRN